MLDHLSSEAKMHEGIQKDNTEIKMYVKTQG